MVNFIDELFKSETPMQMLDEAAPMLANFNGKKTLTTSNNSFNSLFDVQEVQSSINEEYSEEEQAKAADFLETLEN